MVPVKVASADHPNELLSVAVLLERLSHCCLNHCNAKTTGGNINRQPLPNRHELIDRVGFLHLLRACFVEREPLGTVVAIARVNPV